jgi:hypothetical protein
MYGGGLSRHALTGAISVGRAVKPLRIWLVGFGTVGRWLVRALDSQTVRLAARYTSTYPPALSCGSAPLVCGRRDRL